jgi:hypothetical protein
MISAPPNAAALSISLGVSGVTEQVHVLDTANPLVQNATNPLVVDDANPLTETTTESTDNSGSSAASGTDEATNERREDTNGEEIPNEHETQVQFFNTE